uniref:Uncharacterized protein n=1 Tax=Tetraselmis sp. GSL018 TaxID=582737 RepID=A0A061S5U7_9CHLO
MQFLEMMRGNYRARDVLTKG